MKQRLLTLLFIALMMPIGAWAALSVGDRFTVDGFISMLVITAMTLLTEVS